VKDESTKNEATNDLKAFEEINSKILELQLAQRQRKQELKERTDSSRVNWKSKDHSAQEIEVRETLNREIAAVVTEILNIESDYVGRRKRLMDPLEKIPKRKSAKWQPIMTELTRVNEEYLNALATRLSTLTDDYEKSVANLEEYVNSHTEP
jgi:hypothetical protein